jgi:hypothetical protein
MSTLRMGDRARACLRVPCVLAASEVHQFSVFRLADRDVRPCGCSQVIGRCCRMLRVSGCESEEAHDT